MLAGTPRGFNLNNFGGLSGMPSIPGAFPAFFAGHAVQAPLGWPPGSDRGGPVRRGGRQYSGSARSGPYDRQQPRQQRWGDNGGRVSPPGGRPRTGNGAGGRWGDGAAGIAAVGPREAVQGRSLKSYEDLDAVAGAGSGELNY
jgi:hypothetical protein